MITAAEVTPQEQKALITEILATQAFAREGRSARARHILEYLFENHVNGRRVTQGELSLAVYGVNYVKTDSTVRVAVGRLRALLEEYFLGAGREHLVRLQIPSGAYVLVFTRLPKHEDLVGWFWDQYCRPRSNVAFGAVLPEEMRDVWAEEGTRALLHAGQAFSTMLHGKDQKVTFLPSTWQDRRHIGPREDLSRLIIGDDTCLTNFLVDQRTGQIGGESVVGYLGKRMCGFTMFRDPGGRSVVTRLPCPVSVTEVEYDWYFLADTADISYVLLTRSSDSSATATTLLSSANPEACADVAIFITHDQGLEIIASRPEFQNKRLPPNRTPVDFEIVFAVANIDQNSPHWKLEKSLELEEALRRVRIVECLLGDNNYVLAW